MALSGCEVGDGVCSGSPHDAAVPDGSFQACDGICTPVHVLVWPGHHSEGTVRENVSLQASSGAG